MSTCRQLRMLKLLLACSVSLTCLIDQPSRAEPIKSQSRDASSLPTAQDTQIYLQELWPAGGFEANQSSVFDYLSSQSMQELEADLEPLDLAESAPVPSRLLARRGAIQQPAETDLDYDAYRPPAVDFGSPAGNSALLLADQSPVLANQKSAGESGAQQQPQIKIGPQFIREPPGFIHYLNSSDLVIPCSASGYPPPTVSWWHKSSQLEIGSLLDRRYVRYDNSLVISAFKPQDYEPDIHSTTYKCQAHNAFGTIVSRDVVINAVIDQDYEVSVADQFVTVDNDAIFKCQLAPQARDLFQVSGWLEDGQPVGQATGLLAPKSPVPPPSPALGRNQGARALVLPEGQLYVQRVQLRDANRSYRCQLRNLLSGKLQLSSLAGRLFVTDASEQSGTAPRIVDGPKSIVAGKPGDQLVLACLAQGSPRPQVRWLRFNANQQHTQADQLDSGWQADWLSQPDFQARFSTSPEGNLLLIRNLTPADHRTRFRCVANNTFGTHYLDTELRLDLWPSSRLVVVEPKLDFVVATGGANQLKSGQLVLNCTVRQSAAPLLALEWLHDGQPLFSLSLPAQGGGQQTHQPASGSWNQSSMFDDQNQELSAVEHLRPSQPDPSDFDQMADNNLLLLQQSDGRAAGGTDFFAGSVSLAQMQQAAVGELESAGQQPGRQVRLKQRARLFSPAGKPGGHLAQELAILYQLTIEQTRRQDRGAYQCRARTSRNTYQATSHLLLKDNPPQFVDTFPSQLISRAQSSGHHQQQQQQVSLRCVASGSPLPEISWTLSGFQVPESSRFRVGDYVTRDGLIVSFVNISNVQAEDGGLYECLASNDVGQLRHASWLNVTGAPQVRPMAPVTAIAGHQLALMCPAGGWPIDQISWFQNSSKLPLNHRQKSFPNGTLLISELNEQTDQGQYSCQARSGELSALNHVQVTIKVPPVVEPFSLAKSLHRGQRYNIMCTVVRGDLPVQIRWFKDGRLIEDTSGQTASGDSSNIAIKHLDPYSSTLTFASLQSHHRGLYSCEATNEAGRANQSSPLVIHVPPEWKIEPRDLSVTVGRQAVIDCQADAFPAARIEWRLSQDLFREPPTEFKPIISSLYMRVFENGSLIIYNTQRTDAGYYLCQANNGVGAGLSRVIKLTVHVAAHFKSKIRTELVRRGQPAKLRCESIGDPPLEISWLRDKTPLYAQDEARYTLERQQLLDGLVSELAILETDRQDSALFTCIAQNQYGNDDTNIQLLVQGPPDPPLNVRIHEYEARSVRVSWLAGHSGNSPLLKYVVAYVQLSAADLSTFAPAASLMPTVQGQPPNLASYTNVTVSGNETSLLLQNLTPLTEYQFFVLAVNAIGSSRPPVEPIKFRTDDESPAAPPQFVRAQPLSSHSIRVKWRSPERRAHYGATLGFYVGYKLLSGPPNQPNSAGSQQALQPARPSSSADATFVYKTVELIANSTLSSLVQGQMEHECTLVALKRGQKYLIIVQAFNGRGAGPASEPIIAETWRVDVPDPPTLRLVLRTARSVHLAWRLSQDSLSTNNKQLTTSAGQLHKGQAARNPIAMSRLVDLRGDLADELANESLDAEATNLQQSQEEQLNEPIIGFVLTRRQLTTGPSQSSRGETPELGPPVEIRLPSDHLSQIVDNLSCGTRYQFTLVALNSVGPSAPSDPLVVRTEGSTPVAPDKSSLLALNSSSVLINLGAWHNGACTMRSFDVQFKASRSKKWLPLTSHQVNGNLQELTTNSSTSSGSQLAQRSTLTGAGDSKQSSPNHNTTIVLDNLSANLNYDLKIVATNEAGSTEAIYTFNTASGLLISGRADDQQWASQGGEFQLSEANLAELLTSSGALLPWLLFALLLSLALSTGCIMIARKRHTSSSSCSLASRSNHSSSNYYTSTNEQSRQPATAGSVPNGCQQTRVMQTGTLQKLSSSGQVNQSTTGLLGASPNIIHLGDIYGAQRALNDSNKQHHGYMTSTTSSAPTNSSGNSNQRPSSPHNTELGSLMNGSEAEMMVGASALSIQEQATSEANKQACYMGPGLLAKLNKSSTLPANCHQQILQQLMSQQQSADNENNQQQVIDSLMLANMMQQQQQQQQQQHCTNGDAYLALAEANPEVAALLEQQLQQQVYATVKRGCPRPPRLCGDYTVYQCPNGQVAEQMRCCDGSMQPQSSDFGCTYNHHHQPILMQQDTCLQQPQTQQHQSDYQQLRPIN